MPVRRRWLRLAALGVLAATPACGSIVGPDGLLLGDWGGVHLQLTADSAGVRLQYDCATGRIDQPVMVTGGRLHASGTHTPGHGGPDKIDEIPLKLPATYDGVVSGDDLTLAVTLTGTGDRIGVFELKRGRAGQVFACL